MDRAAPGTADRRTDDERSPARRLLAGLDPRAGSGGGPATSLRALPDLPRPMLLAPLAPGERPAPEWAPHNLPHPLTSFVGREREIAEARSLLGGTRLLTLTGTGGVGKTRLAHEVAAGLVDAFRDGVWLVELAALAEATLVPKAVASILEVRKEAERPLTETLVHELRADQLLLVLDNCEHLVGACGALADALLRACPHLRILATSRQTLGVAGETTYPVPSLTLPTEGDGPGSLESEAVRLFAERALAAVPSFTLTGRNASAVERICRRLDGIPLAIELAASRVAVLSPEQIARRLDDRFRLLSGGSRTALPRYRTLRALVDWSHELLETTEQVLFRRLAVFAGGWTLEAAEAVCAFGAGEREQGNGEREEDDFPSPFPVPLSPDAVLDLLSGLVAKSVVLTGEHGDEVRYRFLESLREYAAEKLRDAGEETVLRGRHFDWCLTLAERAEPELAGPCQAVWLRRLDEEHDNFRLALAWSAERGDAGGGLRLGGALYLFWLTRGFLSEGRRWLAELLARSDTPPSSASAARARARALQAAGRLAVNNGDHGAAHHLLVEAMAVARGHNDRPGVAAGAFGLGYLARVRGDYAAARASLGEALELFRELGDVQGIGDTLRSLGVTAHFQDDPVAARSLYEESLAAHRTLGNQKGMAISLNDLGELALEQGDVATARRLEQESLVLASEIGDRERVAYALAALGGVAARQGEFERALRLGAAATSIREAVGDTVSAAWGTRFERWLEPARRALSTEAVAAAWAEGQATPLDQAIDYATRPDGFAEPDGTVSEQPPADPRLSLLTHREREVAALVARGLTNPQIAAALVISPHTAERHVEHILAKLGCSSRAEIAAWTVRHGPTGEHA